MLIALLALTAAAPFTQPQRIDEVRVEGLWLSKEITVLREVAFKAGDEVEDWQWDLTETRLWNLGVFSRVELRLEEIEGKKVAFVKVEDRFPLGPIFRFNFGGGQFYLWAGLQHINFLGRALNLRAFYERFGEYNGFHFSFSDPRLFNERMLGTAEVEWLARPLPEFAVRRAAARLQFEMNLPGTITDRFRYGLRLEGNSDDVFMPGSYDQEKLPEPPPSSMALFIGPYVRLGRLDTDRLRLANGFVELRGRFIPSTEPSRAFGVQGDLESQWFWKLGGRFNAGGRLLAGIQRGTRLQDRFYVGGLDMVRGYAYSEIRALCHITANVELRFVAFDSTWFAVMPVAFVDAGVAHRDTDELQPMASAGAGLRLFIPRLPRFGGRIEVAFPFTAGLSTRAFSPGINFGVGHFFM